MTDHFFPEKHLWEPWVRVEDVSLESDCFSWEVSSASNQLWNNVKNFGMFEHFGAAVAR